MNVLFISQYFYPEQVSNNSIAQNLVQRGHSVEVCTAVPNYPAGRFFPGYSNRKMKRENWQGISAERVFTIPRGSSKLQLLLNYVCFPIASAWNILIRRRKPDIVFVSQLSPVFMVFAGIVQKWLTGAPLVYWVQDIWPESAIVTLKINNHTLINILNRICAWLYLRADFILVQSPAFIEMIERVGVAAERIDVLPNTAPDIYRPVPLIEASHLDKFVPADGFRLMFAGNIGESQDFDNLIEAVRLLDNKLNLKVVVLGSGRDESRVRLKVEEQGLDRFFRFLGRFPEEDMPDFFAHADAMLVSLKQSPIFDRTIPYKVQCYMACGKPIIAALDGIGSQVVNESGAGIAAQASNPSALASAILQMASLSNEHREEIGERGRRYFELNFNKEIVYAKLEDTLEKVAGRSAQISR
jgi:colanic acid biosynthesis glycosyl transferase WcaI